MWNSFQEDINMLLWRIQERMKNLQAKLKDQSKYIKSEMKEISDEISFLKSQLDEHKEKHIKSDKKFLKILFSIYGIIAFILILIFILSLHNETALEVFRLIKLI